MKQLTCEMCGSTDLIKNDGVFICQTCGCKYSVEEAKKMMVEGVVEVYGTVKIDNTDQIKKFYEIASSAFDSNNTLEAERYCNKILEINPEHYMTWLLKGRAAGWQSSLSNNRLEEAVNCFIKAVGLAPEKLKEKMIELSCLEIKSIAVGIVKLQGERFTKWPDAEEANGLKNVVAYICHPVLQFMKSVSTPINILSSVAIVINNSVMDSWNSIIVPDYLNDDDTGHPSDSAFLRLLDRAECCRDLLTYAVDLSDEDDETDLVVYKNLISINERCISSCSWDYRYETLTDLAKKQVASEKQTKKLKSENADLREKNGILEQQVQSLSAELKKPAMFSREKLKKEHDRITKEDELSRKLKRAMLVIDRYGLRAEYEQTRLNSKNMVIE